MGWKETERAFLSTLKKKPEQATSSIPALEEGQRLEGAELTVKQGATKPPEHFNDATLLSAMEHASAEEFALLQDAEHAGLGTPATRAGTIEKLIKSGYVERKKKQLIPTGKGKELIRVMPTELKSAALTAARVSMTSRPAVSPSGKMTASLPRSERS